MFSRLLNHAFIVCFVSVTLLKLSALALEPPPQGSLTLAWDPSTDPTVVGYRLYLGGSSEIYTNITDVGSETAIIILNLFPGATYYFAVTAYDATGLESAFSGELTYTVPPTGSLPQTAVLCWAMKRDPLGRMTLSGTGPVGKVYDVFATHNFLSWLSIGTTFVDSTGLFEFKDPLSSVLPARFYRLHQRAAQ